MKVYKGYTCDGVHTLAPALTSWKESSFAVYKGLAGLIAAPVFWIAIDTAP